MTTRDRTGDDAGLWRISFAELTRSGLPVHVNHPWHDGDIALHDHDFFELAVVISGRAVHRTIHSQKAISRGDAVFINPGQWHAYERGERLEIYNCCFAPSVLGNELAWAGSDPLLSRLLPARLGGGGPSHGVLPLKFTSGDLERVVPELLALARLQDAEDAASARAECIARLLLVLSVASRGVADGSERQGGADPVVAAVVRGFEEDLRREWGLEEVARNVNLNRSYLVRRFKRVTGTSPMAYLARRRAETAAVLLLTTDLPVAEVARAVGWPDQNYFARRFRAVFGTTASAYRAQLPIPALQPRPDDWIRW